MLLTSFKAPGPLVYFEQAAIKRVYISLTKTIFFRFIVFIGLVYILWNGMEMLRIDLIQC